MNDSANAPPIPPVFSAPIDDVSSGSNVSKLSMPEHISNNNDKNINNNGSSTIKNQARGRFSLNHLNSSSSLINKTSDAYTAADRTKGKFHLNHSRNSVFRSTSREILEDDDSFRSSIHSVNTLHDANDDGDDKFGDKNLAFSSSTLDSARNVLPGPSHLPSIDDSDDDCESFIEMTNPSLAKAAGREPASEVKLTRDSILHKGKKIPLLNPKSHTSSTRSRIFSINSRRYNLNRTQYFDVEHFVILPDHPITRCRQFLIECLCFSIGFLAPFFLSFDSYDYSNMMFSNKKWIIASWVLSSVFLFDFFAELVTAVRDEVGQLVIDRREIANKYFWSGWMVIDFIAMLPIIVFYDTAEPDYKTVEQRNSFR